jgi:hypothetical protein
MSLTAIMSNITISSVNGAGAGAEPRYDYKDSTKAECKHSFPFHLF